MSVVKDRVRNWFALITLPSEDVIRFRLNLWEMNEGEATALADKLAAANPTYKITMRQLPCDDEKDDPGLNLRQIIRTLSWGLG